MKICFSGVISFFILVLIPNLLIAQPASDLDRMTLDQKVGQLFLIGFPQQSVDPQLEGFVKKYKISSFILFKRNIKSLSQVAKMNGQLQKISKSVSTVPPLIAVDQEGGQVARVPTKPPIPSALSLGQTQDPELARSLGQETAKIIRTLGFNMNLAPVLDISDPEQNSFIGLRSFGSDPERVANVGFALSKGLLEAAVIPTAKHFPGVGSMSEDPHKVTVEYNASANVLMQRDLKPFVEFAKLGENSAIMLSHFSYPSLDATKTPATLSPKIITGLLRNQMGYRGLIITDDIQMKGLTSIENPHDSALKALLAGADLIMMTWSFKNQAKAIERVKAAVKSGELSEQVLNEKVSRILTVKKYIEDNGPKISDIKSQKVVSLSTKKLREIESQILDFNLKVAQQKRAPANQAPTPEAVCVFSPMNDFLTSYQEANPKSHFLKTTSKTKLEVLQRFFTRQSCQVGIYVIHGPKTASLLERIPSDFSKKLVVVNLSTPYLVKESAKFLNVVNLYFAHPNAGMKVSQNLSGLARPARSGAIAIDE